MVITIAVANYIISGPYKDAWVVQTGRDTKEGSQESRNGKTEPKKNIYLGKRVYFIILKGITLAHTPT